MTTCSHMQALPPAWLLLTTPGTRPYYAYCARTGHCTVRHAEIADAIAQAWRIDAVIGDCETWERGETWEQQALL